MNRELRRNMKLERIRLRKPFHHPGELEVDYEGDFWADHDEDCHGTIDTNSMRREYPDGFIWDCCGKNGNSKGCKQGRGRTLVERYPDSPKFAQKKKSAYFHPGELEVDYEGDCWADHDEDCHGRIDTNSMRREYPEGFIWSCCNAVGSYAKGCKKKEDKQSLNLSTPIIITENNYLINLENKENTCRKQETKESQTSNSNKNLDSTNENPNKPYTAYMLYSIEERKKANAEEIEDREILKEISIRWEKLAEKEKQIYEDMA